MRLSDILKKNSQNSQGQTPAPQTGNPQPASPPNEIPQTPSVFRPPEEHNSLAAAEEAYAKAITEIKNIINNAEKGITCSSPIESVPVLVDLIDNDNTEILIFADRATPDIFLFGHCVNLCIFSLFLGKGFDLPREKMLSLGFCALLSDIGLSKTDNEQKNIPEGVSLKKHGLNAQDIVKKLPGLTEDIRKLILDVMIQKQTRKIFAVSTDSINGNDIHDFARIIAVADAYETLTHPRPGRERALPHEALKTMISSAEQEFDSETIKLLIERISLYPPGSYVKLNSDEIGKVVGLNKGLPTRPKVRVMVDATSQRIAERKVIDLASNPMIFIKEPIDETRLNLPDKKLALELKAARWWVKGL